MSKEAHENIELIVRERWVELVVRVQPRSSMDEIAGMMDGSLKIRLAAPPEAGKANQALQSFLAKRLRIAKRDVEITSGHSSRLKRLRLHGVSVADFYAGIPEIHRLAWIIRRE